MKEEHDIRIIIDDSGLWCTWNKLGKVKTYTCIGESGDYAAFIERITKLAKTGLDPEDKKD